jgi:choline dehydrogenase-like flavoprotein
MAQKIYDVVIVGSGHSGGMAAKILTERGANVLMLNAGPVLDNTRDRVNKFAYELPYRGFGKPGRLSHVVQANEYNANQWVDEQEIPYTHDPANPYNWVRVRTFGGRSLYWARQSFRLSDYEFKAGEWDGTENNWPVSHADMDPFYRRVEEIFRVSGRNEGNLKQFPDGNIIEPNRPPDSLTIQRITDLAQKRGWGVSKMRSSGGIGGLAASTNLLIPDAVATGKLDIVTNAIAREVSIDKNTGLASGVHFVDRHSRQERHVKARIVVLAAGTLESTRLILNSGIANSSGHVGRYLSDQIYGVQVHASVPEARDGKVVPGLMGGQAFLPRFRNIRKDQLSKFIGGYCAMIGSGGGAQATHFPLYGAELQKKLASYQGSVVNGTIYGERPARYENHVRINKTVSDAWGIPALHIEVKDGVNEFAMAKDAADTFEEMFKTLGWEVFSKTDKFHPPGYSIHEVGTMRMGDNPKKSVLNKWSQFHDIKNMAAVDGSGFVTCGWQNPTLTILSLSMRASEHLADEMAKKNL